MKVSRKRTLSRRATERLVELLGRQSTPSRSHAHPNSPRISAEVFEKWYRGYGGARAMLREHARPVLPAGVNFGAADEPDASYLVRQDVTDSKLTFVHQVWIGVATGDAKDEDSSSRFRNAAVAEVETQEIRIRSG